MRKGFGWLTSKLTRGLSNAHQLDHWKALKGRDLLTGLELPGINFPHFRTVAAGRMTWREAIDPKL